MKEKLLTLVLSFFCLTAAQGQDVTSGTILLGDANGDGVVNVADIVEISSYLTDHPSTLFKFDNADTNHDGVVNAQDVNEVADIIMGSSKLCFYAYDPAPEDSEWDDVLLTSNGYCATVKTDDDGVASVVLDQLGSKDDSKSVFAQFDSNQNPIVLVADNIVYFFENRRDNIVDIVKIEKGEATIMPDVTIGQIFNNVRTRGDVSQNYGFSLISSLCSFITIISGGPQAAAEGTMLAISYATQNGTNAEGKFVISLLPVVVSLIAKNPAGAIIGGAVSVIKYFEDKINEAKRQYYHISAGYCEVETLDPKKHSYNSYLIGVKVTNSSSIPSQYKGYNYFGLIIKKLRLHEMPPYVLNLYDKDTEVIIYKPILDDDEDYVTLVDIEPGYKYIYKAFVLTYYERLKYEIGKGSALSSFAYYGDPKNILINYARINEYKQNSVTYVNDKLKFTVDVTAQFNNTKYPNDIAGWGVCLYKDGEPFGQKDYPINLNQSEGKVSIEFEADKSSITNDFANFEATTKDLWSVGTYVDYKGDDYEVRHRFEEIEKLDLIYDEKPSAITLNKNNVVGNTAKVYCQYKGCLYWEVKCGVEYSANNKTETLEVIPENEDEVVISLNNLMPNTQYQYRAYYELNGEKIYGEPYFFTTENATLCPDDNHPHMIDLGLSSGNKWSCCDHGSNIPWQEGGKKKNSEVKQNMDSKSVPSYSDAWELGECKMEETTIHDKNGVLVTGKNGNQIFFPYDSNGVTSGFAMYWCSDHGDYFFYDGYQAFTPDVSRYLDSLELRVRYIQKK